LATAPEPQTTEALRAGERKMLAVLACHRAFRITRAQLGTLADFAPSGGTFGAYLGTLRRNGLIELRGDQLRASETLFLGAAA
jgi:hypothetical protein